VLPAYRPIMLFTLVLKKEQDIFYFSSKTYPKYSAGDWDIVRFIHLFIYNMHIQNKHSTDTY